MSKRKKHKKIKRNKKTSTGWKRATGAGRPTLADDIRRDSSLRFRTTIAETDLMELASRLCNFKLRSRWAMTRLVFLARSVVLNKAKIDPNDHRAVRKMLQQVPKGSKK